ncbi:MAG: aminotransferase class I/II-fold pyridoxal phosphate-dependent enzyme, partial [Bacteroidales bacterium]|nr:aminotransferase class I/II-fold pyridoxal phosphate-dependent enzyme [Bacteroidales bacterium]
IFFPKKGILGQTADAKGKAINATIGAAIEDDGSPMRLASLERLIKMEPSLTFPYAPSFGRPDLRKQWKKMTFEKNPSLNKINVSLPVVTNALTHGLSIAGYLFSNPGDNILLSDLYWGNYNLIFKHGYNSIIDTFKLFDGNGFNIESFRNKVLNGNTTKKIILLNFPNNPTGYTPTTVEMNSITNVLLEAAERGNKLAIIIDDAYFGLVYEDGIETESIFVKLANLHRNLLAIKIDGATKEDYVWGFRVGFITYGIKDGTNELYEALASKTAGAVRGNISNACNLSQSLLLKAFQSANYQSEKTQKYTILKSRANKVKEVLSDKKYEQYFTALPFNSGYFMCIQLKDTIDGEALRKLLNKKYDTGVISLSNIIRIAFSGVAVDKIELLFDNIFNACKELTENKN